VTLRVLIASRKAVTRERLRAALEEHGYDVCASCADAGEVITAVRRRRPDIGLIHLDLPGGAITTCRALTARRNPPRIIVLAPASRESDLAPAIRAGADGFIVDDLDPRNVPAAVAEVAAGRPYLSGSSTARLIAELRASNNQRIPNPRREER
jgi:DNA-binding NarL/FixJ family response regulator